MPFWLGLAAIGAALWVRRSVGSGPSLAEIRESERQCRLMAARLDRMREQENRQLARRIHDDLGQTMTALRFDLSALMRKLDGQPDLQERVRGMMALADEAAKSAREISIETRAGVVEQVGLVGALESLGAAFQKEHGVPVRLEPEMETVNAGPERELALFRIAEEALRNIGRHARATKVTIRLAETAGGFCMEIEDDGIGIAAAEIERPSSFGLISMRERARAAEARLWIGSAAGAGTVVRVTAAGREASC